MFPRLFTYMILLDSGILARVIFYHASYFSDNFPPVIPKQNLQCIFSVYMMKVDSSFEFVKVNHLQHPFS